MAVQQQKNVLIIDGQVFQTSAWHRGMGKYSFNLLEVLFASPERDFYDKIILLLNSQLELEKDSEEKLKKIAVNVEIAYVDLEISKSKKIKDVQPRNKLILQDYIDHNFSQDYTVHFLLLSLFLGETTCVVFPDRAKKLLLFYDLIPFLYAERYTKRIPYEDYLANFETVFEADMLFSISQTVADDLAVYLGIAQKNIKNINGAAIDRSSLKSVRPAIEVGSKFILMPSGDEIRKNNNRAVKGFDQFNHAHENEYKLVLTSFFSEATTEELKNVSDSIIFTGNITESELRWLYENADLLLFASEYEGLGLPVLEAMAFGKKIACSDIPVFREISNDAFYYFDHMKPSSISVGISRALNDKSFAKKQSKYKTILSKYTWENSASDFYIAIKELQRSDSSKDPVQKPRLAIFTPHPAGFSAIGKVVAESHSAMSEIFDVDYYYDYGLYHREVRPDYLSSIANCYDATEFNAKRYVEYDAVIYHVGNSDYHLETIKNALYMPGYIILHDTYLEGAYERLKIDGYMPEQRIKLEKVLNKAFKPQRSRYLTTLVNAQKGVICHSNYAKKTVEQLIINDDVLVSRIELPVGMPILNNIKGNQEKLNICFAGIFADVKGLEIIEQIARSLGSDGAEINIFGFDFAEPDSIGRLKELPNVQVIANPSDFEFQTLLSKQDILINYRLAYRGETSLTTLEAMRYGVVPIVRDIGWYGELPDQSVIKLASKENVLETILDLYDDRDKLEQLSKSAIKTVSDSFSHENYAIKISDIIATQAKEGSLNVRIAAKLKQGASLQALLKEL